MHRPAFCIEFRRTGHGKVVGKTHGEVNFDGDVYMILYVTLNIKLNMKFHGEKFRFTGLKSG